MAASFRRRLLLVLAVVVLSLHLVAATLIALGTASEAADPLGKPAAGRSDIAVDGYQGAVSSCQLNMSCAITDGWLVGTMLDGTSHPAAPPCTPGNVHVGPPANLDLPVDPGTGSYGPVSLPAGSYVLTATAVSYPFPFIVDVQIVAGTGTAMDFHMIRPAAEVSPSDFIGIQGTVNQPFTELLTVINSGDWQMSWEISELGGDLPWLSESPITGTIPSLGQQGVDVNFLCPSLGDFSGSLLVEHSDPCTPAIEVPILLSCFLPSGWLEGQVMDVATQPPDAPCTTAWVEIDPNGLTVGVDPATGHYGPEMLPEGSYDLTGWAVGYPVPDVVSGVAIVAGTTTTQDLSLDRPAAAVTPSDLLGVTGIVNEPFFETLTVLNDGTWELDWQIVEVGGDLPWVWENPITGTVPAASQFGVEVGFLCPEAGDFYGDLLVLLSDPCTPGFDIPIWLNCDSPGPDIFADGFESGDTTAWSWMVP